jgi:hypothetical protein
MCLQNARLCHHSPATQPVNHPTPPPPHCNTWSSTVTHHTQHCNTRSTVTHAVLLIHTQHCNTRRHSRNSSDCPFNYYISRILFYFSFFVLQFFYQPEIFDNINKFNFGVKQVSSRLSLCLSVCLIVWFTAFQPYL